MKTYPEKPEEIQKLEELDLSGTYSYADYLRWKFEDRLELIKGRIFKMSPAPARLHQKVSRELSKALILYLDNKPCEMYTAPFDVRLPGKKRTTRIFTRSCNLTFASFAIHRNWMTAVASELRILSLRSFLPETTGKN